MISPDTFYPGLLLICIICNLILFAVAATCWIKSKLGAFFLLAIGAVCGGTSNVCDLFITFARIQEKGDEWKAALITAYNVTIITSPLAAIFTIFGVSLLCLKLAKLHLLQLEGSKLQ